MSARWTFQVSIGCSGPGPFVALFDDVFLREQATGQYGQAAIFATAPVRETGALSRRKG
jgi:hypothetical protein